MVEEHELLAGLDTCQPDDLDDLRPGICVQDLGFPAGGRVDARDDIWF